MSSKIFVFTFLGTISFTLNGCGKTGEDITNSSPGSETTSSDSVVYSIDESPVKDIYDCATDKGIVDRAAKLAWTASLRAGDDVDRFINTIAEVSPKMARGALSASLDNVKFFCNLKGYSSGSQTRTGSFFSPGGNFVYSWDPINRRFSKLPAANSNKTITGIQCSGRLNNSCTANRKWIFSARKISAKWSSIDLLPARGNVLTASIGNDILINGTDGYGEFPSTLLPGTVTILNTINGSQTHLKLPSVTSPAFIRIVGNKAIFVERSGRQVDIYDLSSKKFSSTQLSSNFPQDSRELISVDRSKMILMGFFDEIYPSKLVEIYDANRDSWTKTELPTIRTSQSSVMVGGRLVIAGGYTGSHIRDPKFLSTVDIYDFSKDSKNAWSTTSLPGGARFYIGSVAVGSQIFFAGGHNYVRKFSSVDVFDVLTNKWELMQLSVPRTDVQAIAVGSKVLFIGGDTAFQEPSDVVDIYDIATKKWSAAKLSSRRQIRVDNVVKVDNKVVIAGGYDTSNERFSSAVDIYDAESNTWSTSNMLAPVFNTQPTAIGSKVYFIGGHTRKPNSSDLVPSGSIQTLELGYD